MRHIAYVLILISAIAAPASAGCKEEVADAFEQQRKRSSFRMETNLINEQGPISMTVDYILPDRMHQRVKVLTTSEVSETILIGDKAWAKEDKGWSELPPELTESLSKQVKSSLVEPPKELADFTCADKAVVDGKQYFAYRTEGTGEKSAQGSQGGKTPFRILHVDPTTGLPARNLFVLPGREDKPIFKTVYSYPADLRIEPPAQVQN